VIEPIERGQDRRKEQVLFYDAIIDRREADRRACAEPLTWSEQQPGAIRPAPGEVVALERRRFADAGME
jgi:hypothetical protein